MGIQCLVVWIKTQNLVVASTAVYNHNWCEVQTRPDNSWRQQRRLPPYPLVNALKCFSNNLHRYCSYRCPFCLGALALSKTKHTGLLKPLDPFGKQYCPRPTLSVSQLCVYKITYLWKFRLNRTLESGENNGKTHPCFPTFCHVMTCV